MTQNQSSEIEQARKSTEIRIGLVMVGGVSLAIYMNGVTREFFDMVHGTGIYKLLKVLADSDVVIDIISGTSAGGVNGILLGYAFANGLDFHSTSEMWRELADISILLHESDADGITSLLDGQKHYLEKIDTALKRMTDTAYRNNGTHEPSHIESLDLFVTGTSLDGNISTVFDDAGHPIDIKDHRNVFRLKFRKDRTNDLSREHLKALGKLARLTSSFPAAFAPVSIGKEAEKEADNELKQWGKLHWSDFTTPRYFVDGGLLDNKPFTHTINAIFRRLADRKVDRYLYYVDPDPDRFNMNNVEPDANTTCPGPSFTKVTGASLFGIKNYETIADDLKLIREHNNQVQRLNALWDVAKSCGSLQPSEVQTRLYHMSRCNAIRDRAVQGLLRSDGQDFYSDDKDHRERASKLVTAFDTWSNKQDVSAQKEVETFDVYFRLRRLYHLAYLIEDMVAHNSSQDNVNELTDIWRAINLQIKILEIVQYSMETMIDTVNIQWEDYSRKTVVVRPMGEIWNDVRSLFHYLLAVTEDEESFPEAYRISHTADPKSMKRLRENDVESLHRILSVRLQKAKQESNSVGPENHAQEQRSHYSVLQASDRYETWLFTTYETEIARKVEAEYQKFECLDTHVYPLSYLANLQERDLIKIVRLSPIDAQKGFGYTANHKVAGTSLAHFSAFFKRSWRSNDILWGRLDTLCQLTECILLKERLKKIVTNPLLHGRIYKRLFFDARQLRPEFDLTKLFPHSPVGAHLKLQEWLCRLLGPNEDLERRTQALDELDQYLELLITMGQLEIIATDTKTVLADAVFQENHWNVLRTPFLLKQLEKTRTSKAKQAGHPFKTNDGVNDKLVSKLAADLYIDDALKHFEDKPKGEDPKQTKWGIFFENNYQVGAETISDGIPRLVLIELLVRALLVCRTCLLTSMSPKIRQSIEGHFLFKWLINRPLKVAAYFSSLWLRQPKAVVATHTAVSVAAVLTLTISVVWMDPILYKDSINNFHPRAFLVMVLLPLLIMVTLIEYGPRYAKAVLAILLAMAIGLAALALVLPSSIGVN